MIKKMKYSLLTILLISISINTLSFASEVEMFNLLEDLPDTLELELDEDVEEYEIEKEEISTDITLIEHGSTIDDSYLATEIFEIPEEQVIEKTIEEVISGDSELIPSAPALEIIPVQEIAFITFTDRVYNKINDEGIEGVEITALNKDTGDSYFTVSDESGYFILELNPGTYEFTLKRKGFKAINKEVVIEPKEISDNNVLPEENEVIQGQ